MYITVSSQSVDSFDMTVNTPELFHLKKYVLNNAHIDKT